MAPLPVTSDVQYWIVRGQLSETTSSGLSQSLGSVHASVCEQRVTSPVERFVIVSVYVPAVVAEMQRALLVAERGGRAATYREEDGARVMKEAEITIRVDLARGQVGAIVWTCDFSYDYVKINADYRS